MRQKDRKQEQQQKIDLGFVEEFIRLNLSTEDGAKTARSIIQDKLPKFISNLQGTKFTQVRKHYNYLLTIYLQTKKSNNYFYTQGQLKLGMGKVFAVYDKNRGHINEAFKEFLIKLYTSIKTPQELEKGKVLFEALIGYTKGKLKD